MRQRVNIQNFERWERNRVDELCLIIAEVLKMPADYSIKINGTLLPVSLVQEIFWMIDERHIGTVMEHFDKIEYRVNNKRAYLKTALYNSVFELEHNYDNEANAREENV